MLGLQISVSMSLFLLPFSVVRSETDKRKLSWSLVKYSKWPPDDWKEAFKNGVGAIEIKQQTI